MFSKGQDWSKLKKLSYLTWVRFDYPLTVDSYNLQCILFGPALWTVYDFRRLCCGECDQKYIPRRSLVVGWKSGPGDYLWKEIVWDLWRSESSRSWCTIDFRRFILGCQKVNYLAIYHRVKFATVQDSPTCNFHVGFCWGILRSKGK